MGKSVGIEPLFSDAEKHDGTMRDRLQKPDVPVSGERATTLNILMAQYRRQYYRDRFICTEREERIVKEGGERGRRSKRRIVSNPFLDRSSIPKLARATKRWGPHGTIRPRQAAKRKSPFFEWHTPQTRRRKVLQIRKYQKPAFCAARTRAGGELQLVSARFCLCIKKRARIERITFDHFGNI